MPSILGANTLSSGSYDVANSVRFDDGDSAYMHKDQSAGDRNKATFSAWIKRSHLGSNQAFFGIHGASSDAGQIEIRFQGSGDSLHCTGHASNWRRTNRAFRDISAWYHIVVAFDTTQGTAGNRVKVYVNGVQETSFAAAEDPDENEDLAWGLNNAKVVIGSNYNADSPGDYFDGYMAEVVLIDGQQLDPTSFGEFDEDSPTIWKPIDVSGLTFGTNGFYLDFKDSSNLGNDANGGTDLTEVNLAATDQSTDTCTNNFATLNPIFNNIANLTYSEGNLNVVAADANYRSTVSTIGVSKGKWYAEFKAVSGFNSTDKAVGIYRSDTIFVATTGLGNFTTGFTFSYGATGNVRTNNGNNDTGEATFTDGDIIQVAMDLDNNKLYFGKNNTYINSGDPTTGSTGTGAYSITASTGEVFYFAVASISSGGAALWSCNFGSPSYANSSDASDANGYGAFEFAPPSGYYALNTKNLAEYG